MSWRCSVRGCGKRNQAKAKDVVIHRFPEKDLELCSKWLAAIGKTKRKPGRRPSHTPKKSQPEVSSEKENAPTALSACSEAEEMSWLKAIKSLQTPQGSNIFKSREVLVNTQCLLELFQFCWLCQKECCITIEGNEKLFSVTQDCQSCGYHRDWRSHPPSAEPAHTFHKEAEHAPKHEEVVVHTGSSANKCSEQSHEQVFTEEDGSYLSSEDEEASLQEEEVKTKKRKSKGQDSSDEQELHSDAEATDSDVSMDEDLFTALKEDGQGKLVVWCTQCGTEASLSCSVHRHKKVFCCAQCSEGDNIKTHTFETLRIRFDDVGSFQKHAEQEHGSKPFYILCQDCGKFVIAKKEHTKRKPGRRPSHTPKKSQPEVSSGKENAPTPGTACSEVEESSWINAVKSLQTPQGANIFRSSEVIVNTQCLLELFQFCWLCQKECCITIEGNEKLFSVTQDCQSCGHHRHWRSHPPSAEATHTFHKEAEHALKHEDDEEVVVHIVSSDNECSEQVFIEKDGSYLSSNDEEASLQEEEVKKKRKRKAKRKHSSDEWEPCLDAEATDSDVSMDEDLFTALKEDGQGKLVVWCTQCGTEASLSCSVHRHKKVFCCAQCSEGDDIQAHHFETLRVRFDDVGSFQKHAEQEHGVKPFYRLCQDCGKFVIADPESRGLKEHKCEHKSKFIICPECGKRFLTKVGLKSHYTQLHSDYDHPCKYCLKVFKTSDSLMHFLLLTEFL
ncbi:hypothetical protein PHYPO_G00189540 [Pangasianodon hypophthalmus]|uniref:C2H2-type domain-containing protein n=1 Tax=Pangasianodon hypophthalmus TaxID=310915 RepID=A0A5N5PH79_PANHP|nr:hypothetical protein PHYPO_G00189540 [Pangasianodon hypophthalmus]